MRHKNKIAIAYDFDGTLAPGNMQEYAFIPSLKMNIQQFWIEANELAEKHDMDQVLAYMYLMLEKAKQQGISIKKEDFKKFGAQISYYPGVLEYFDRITAYAATQGYEVEHYIISSGNRELVAGSAIAPYFTDIFASGFMYDDNDNACWPTLAVNYTNKTQFLFRINKGIHNSYDNTLINKIVKQEDKPIPFSNMIYIGDGETDIPAMKMVKMQGGNTIAVYNPDIVKTDSGRKTPKEICEEIILQDRADYISAADYTENSPLDLSIKRCIDKIIAEQELNKIKDEALSHLV